MIPDSDLLRRYARKRDEGAFTELVGRHLNHVYSTALRLVAGDAHLAEDVAQAVFTDLARKAATLQQCQSLSSWLHTSARFAAAKVVRTEQRRRTREQANLVMTEIDSNQDPNWNQLRPILDETIGELHEPDREALLLRYFEKKPFAELGAVLGVSENAARMRVERATDRLRARLALRGITSTAAALGSVLAQSVVENAPVALQAKIAQQAITATASTGLVAWLASLSPATKVAAGAAATGVVLALCMALLNHKTPSTGTAAVTATTLPESPGSQKTAEPSSGLAAPKPAVASDTANSTAHGLELFFVDDKTGLAITNQVIGLKGWMRDEHLMVEKEVKLDEGRCTAPFELMARSTYSILTRIPGYADVRMRWNLAQGETLPEWHTVRLVAPSHIGGRVLGPAGEPVSGATVGFNTENVSAQDSFTEDHCVDYLTTKTDSDGRWQMDRLAPEMVGRIFGSASHPEYSPSAMIHVSHKPELVDQLLQGKLILQLGAGVTVSGLVVDSSGNPIADASVRVGLLSTSSSSETRTGPDGTFRMVGCRPGNGLITAQAEGFAPTAAAANLVPGIAPIKLVLSQGEVLRLRIVDSAGMPVRGASVMLDSFPRRERVDPVPQIDFRQSSDGDGRIVWANAPRQQLPFGVNAPGYLRTGIQATPGEPEQVVTLQRALTIAGTVRDAVTHELIPKVRLGIGWVQTNGDGSVQPQWSTIERFWITFKGGRFQHTLDETVAGDATNAAYVFRFEAEGHAPFITRVYQGSEGEAEFDVAMVPVEDISAIAYAADGQRAANVQVGLMFPGSDAQLVPGGFAGDLGYALASVSRADSQGRFSVPGANSNILSVVIAGPEGYAQTTLDELRTVHAVRLKPWASLRGRFLSNGIPVANARLGLFPFGRLLLSLSPSVFETVTAEDGAFALAKVPPGSFAIFRLDTNPSAKVGTVEIAPGEVKEVVLPDQEISDER